MQPAKGKLVVNATAVAMLGLMAGLMFASAWNDTIIFDEDPHIGAGYSYLRTADHRLNHEHPPLMKDLGAFPLLWMNLREPWDDRTWMESDQWGFGQKLIFGSGNDADAITRAAKAPMIVFTALLGWVIFGWARKHFGAASGLLALFFYAFSPTFLAHGRLVTTDVGAAAGFFIGTTAFLRFLNNPTRRNVLLAGFAMGFAFLTKFSTFVLVPIAVILAIAWALVQEEPGNRARGLFRHLTRTAGIFVVAFLAIYPVYLHHTWNYPPKRQRVETIANLAGHGVGHTPKNIVIRASDKPVIRPWAEYFLGLLTAVQIAAAGNNPFFLGDVSGAGLHLYFPLVYGVKEPLALHVLTLIALAFGISGALQPLYTRRWLAARFTVVAFLVVIAVYWGVSIRSNLHIGVRHVLPTFPFIYILVASEIASLDRRLRGASTEGALPHNEAGEPGPGWRPAANWGFRPIGAFRMLLGALLAWQAVTVLRAHPSYLAYFNEIAGGPDGGYQYVVDSNLDWGQDLKRLAEFVEERGIPEIHFDYFGTADPAYYLKEKYRAFSSCAGPQKGWVAVSAMSYQGSRAKPECDYRRWLPMEKLVTKIGYSIFVFRLE
ncbi:MAG TPA: glycosyltransferase family 39 protein [Anaerolineales bacterium]